MRGFGNVEPWRNESGHLMIMEGDGYHSDTYDLTAGIKVTDEEAA